MPREKTTKQDLFSLLRTSAPRSWRELVDGLDCRSAKAITQLRKLVRGLERNGELHRDLDGRYYLPPESPSAIAAVVRKGRKLTVAGHDVIDGRRFNLREGDEVSFVATGDTLKILDVVKFSTAPLVGVLQRRGRSAYVEALGEVRGRVSLLSPPVVGSHGDTVKVTVSGRDGRGLVGEVIEVVSHDNVVEQAITSAIAAYALPDSWPDDVSKACGRLPKTVQKGRFSHRRDLTKLALVTIDGETAKDFDDAVFAARSRSGWRLVVAIADVAHYVKSGSALDREAENRGTSAYFPGHVVPMLPEVLSNGLCSLRPREQRLSLVCDMHVTQSGRVSAFDFYEAVIYSHARLTYTEVQRFQDEGIAPANCADDTAVLESLAQLFALFEVLRKSREKRGALDLATREGQLILAGGRVQAIAPTQRLMAHQLIEEAMIAANVCAARFLEAHDTPSLYRVHEPPELDKLKELRQVLAYSGVRLPDGHVAPGDLQAALDKVPTRTNAWLFAQLALRTMQQAVYTPDNKGHYGLALERYMHFTSPIRRYPDLLVHRAIKAVVSGKGEDRLPSMDALHWLGESCSTNERRAESAGWLVDAWLKCDHLLPRMGETFSGVIAAVTDFGLFVELEGYYIQGLLHVSNLGRDYFTYQPRSMSLVGESSGRKFVIGDRLKVVLAHVEPELGKIDLRLPEFSNASGGLRERRRGRSDKARSDKARSDKGRTEKGGKRRGRRR